MDLTDIYRTFHPKVARDTFFSRVHGTFTMTDYIPEHKTSLNTFKRIQFTQLCSQIKTEFSQKPVTENMQKNFGS